MVRMIRAVQPVGPYRVGGWSFGGILAYEIATQLIGADQQVDFLGLFDTFYSGGGTYQSPESHIEFDDKKALLHVIEFYLAAGQHPRPAQDMEPAMVELRAAVNTMDLAAFVQKCHSLTLMPKRYSHLTTAQLEQTFARERAHRLADFQYYAQPLPIPVHLFVAQGNKTSCLPGWNAVVPSGLLRITLLDGDHESIMHTPHVEFFGNALSHAVRKGGESQRVLAESSYSPLIALQSGRQNIAPLFCLPGAGANVTSFTELTTCLERSQPVYGLQPRGLEGELVPHTTVFAAVECYVRAINEIYPRGPVHLLGHSFGGWLAFQLAQTLLQSGRTIGSCTILDSEVPDRDARILREYNNTEALMKWVDTFDLVLGRPLGVSRTDIDSRSEAVQRGLLHDRLVAEGLMPVRSDPDMLRGPLRTFAASLRTHFRPDRPYTGQVRLVLVDDPALDEVANRQNQQETTDGWKRWVPNLRSTHGPGNHLTILKRPHVQALADLIQEDLSGKYTSQKNLEDLRFVSRVVFRG
jgi:thioesterase domain-containing protein